MSPLEQINQFIESQPLALAGVSRNPKKFGYTAFKELKSKGMNVFPINPETNEIMGEKVYQCIKDLPGNVRGIIIMTSKEKSASVVREALDRGIKQIWFQQMSDSEEALDLVKSSGINYITGECILMHYKPNSFHKFHRAINKLFGKFPQ